MGRIQMGTLTKMPDNFFGPPDSTGKMALECLHYFNFNTNLLTNISRWIFHIRLLVSYQVEY